MLSKDIAELMMGQSRMINGSDNGGNSGHESGDSAGCSETENRRNYVSIAGQVAIQKLTVSLAFSDSESSTILSAEISENLW